MMLQRIFRYITLSIILAIMASILLILIPASTVFGEKTGSVISIVLAAMFWISLVLEQIFFWLADTGRKKFLKRFFTGRKIVNPSIGIISFGCNKEARVSDLAFFAALITTVCLIVFQAQNQWLICGALSVLLLSFTFHCIFNGITYRYIKVFRKIKKEPKKHENI